MTTDSVITHILVPEEHRLDLTAELFGMHFPLAIEPAIFTFASRLSPEYNGGYWDFYELRNGGFFMAPDADSYTVTSDNGWQRTMSGEAFGICCCLYAYSHMSFSQRDDLAELSQLGISHRAVAEEANTCPAAS